MSPLSTSSSGSVPANSRWPSSAIATPSRTRSNPDRQVLASMRLELEGLPVLRRRSPSARSTPRTHCSSARQVVVGEAEPAAHGLAPGEVEHLARRHARRGELEHLRQDAHHRVGLAQGAVGQPDLELARAVDATSLLVVRAERRLNQRREVLDVGAHDDDVARLELRVLLQQVQDGVAQHLDLPAAAVAGMHADAVVAGCQQRAGVAVATAAPRRCAVGPDVVLDPLQQCRRRPRRGSAVHLVAVCHRPAEHELHLAGVAPPRRQQRVARRRCRRVLPARQMPRRRDRRASRGAPTARATGGAGRGGRRDRAATASRTSR